MCLREVTHSCGHICRETIEPLGLSLWMEPISVPQRCWRCLGERPRPNISYYGDYRIEFTGYPEAPSETPSETGTFHNVSAPATSSKTNPNSSHALQSLFVPVFDSRDPSDQSPHSAYPSAPESDADRRQTFSPTDPTPSSRPGSRPERANRYAQVIDGTLYSSHEDPGVPVPDFHFAPRGLDPAPSTDEALEVAATYDDDPSRVSAGDKTAETETGPPIHTHSGPSHLEGSEIEFSGLSIRPDTPQGHPPSPDRIHSLQCDWRQKLETAIRRT